MISRAEMRIEGKHPAYKDVFSNVVFTWSHWWVNLWGVTLFSGFHIKKNLECHQLLFQLRRSQTQSFHSFFRTSVCPGILWKMGTQDTSDEDWTSHKALLWDGQGWSEVYQKHSVLYLIHHIKLYDFHELFLKKSSFASKQPKAMSKRWKCIVLLLFTQHLIMCSLATHGTKRF